VIVLSRGIAVRARDRPGFSEKGRGRRVWTGGRRKEKMKGGDTLWLLLNHRKFLFQH
jgi:hypothetical protein